MVTVSKSEFLNTLMSIIDSNSELSKPAKELYDTMVDPGCPMALSGYLDIGFYVSVEEDYDDSSWGIYYDGDLWCESDCVPSRDSWWNLMLHLGERLA